DNAGGDSASSNQASATLVPAVPGGLTASAVSTTQINLAWSDVAGETGFKIERSLDGVNWAQVATTAAGVTSYQDTALNGGTTYDYRVRATNAGGDSAYSNHTSATPPAAPPVPATPTGLTATALSASKIQLSWTDNAINETGYRVFRSVNGGTWSQ